MGVAVVLFSVVAIIVSWRRIPVVAFGLLWFGLSLLPVSNVLVPTGVLLAERTLFLPSIGFLIACAGAGEALLRRRPAMSYQKSLAVAAAVAVVLGTVRSAMRMRIWHDSQTLAVASVRDAPRSWRVQRAYGEALFDIGQPRDGVQAYVRSIQWAPEPWFVRNGLSRRLRMIGDDAAALEQLRESLRQRPGQREATAELAAALLGVGRYAEARRLADSVIVVDNAPPIMVWLRQLADSAAAVGAPPGTVKLGVRGP
jgi:hypothetical protein